MPVTGIDRMLRSRWEIHGGRSAGPVVHPADSRAAALETHAGLGCPGSQALVGLIPTGVIRRC